MVGDKEVVDVLLRKLLEPTYRDGVVLDGFPRTPVQVECLKLLVDKINELHDHFAATPLAIHFRRPTIHAMVLFVSESTSIARQLGRGREIAEHNRKVAETGIGMPIELRATDLVRRARATALSGLQGADVGGADVAAAALSLSLHQRRRSDRRGAGQHPQGAQVSELAGAGPAHVRAAARRCRSPRNSSSTAGRSWSSGSTATSWNIPQLLSQIVELVASKFMPIITRHALSGRAHVNSEDPIFDEPLAIPMLIDLFSERGYHAVVDKQIQEDSGAGRPGHRRDQVPRESRLPHPDPVRGVRRIRRG